VFTQEDNSELVATDTQKNTIYVVAKRSNATTCEVSASGCLLCMRCRGDCITVLQVQHCCLTLSPILLSSVMRVLSR
jgi:hypothetical protein